LSLLLAVAVFGFGLLLLEPLLSMMKLDPAVHHIAKHYLIGLSCGLIPLFAANVLRHFFNALVHTRIMMFIMIVAVRFNIALNYLLIIGKWGFPRLGGIGTGYATSITYWFILIISILVTFKVDGIRPYSLFVTWFSPSLKAWKEQLSIGVPMGLSVFFEASIFS